MDRKRSRDPDDEDDSVTGKRTRLEAEAAEAIAAASRSHADADAAVAPVATAPASSNAMQAFAHEALAMSNGTGLAALASAANSLNNSNAARTVDRAVEQNVGNNAVVPLAPPQIGADHPDHAGATSEPVTKLDTLSDITRCFRAAVLKGWDRRAPTYETVEVLLLYWEEDFYDPNENVCQDVTRLESVFRNSYRFGTSSYGIRSNAPEKLLYDQVEAFFHKNDNPGNLAIVYYAGQSVANNRAGDAPNWVPRRKCFTNSVESAPIQAYCENANCDVLLFFDYCNAYHYPLNKNSYGTPLRNVIEVVDCPSLDPDTGGVSFSTALADELEANAAEGIDVKALHTKVTKRMVRARPASRPVSRPVGRPVGRPPKDSIPISSKTTVEEYKQVPKHYWLFRRRSIVLVAQPAEAQVVLCLRILGGSVEVNSWGKWIYDTVYDARQTVQVEGVYSGFSTMMTIRVPVSQWHLFTPCPARSFVAYTTIGHIEPDVLEKIDEAMADKLWASSDPLMGLDSEPPENSIAQAVAAATASAVGAAAPSLAGAGSGSGSGGGDSDVYGRAGGAKRARKALPTARKILPSEGSSPMQGARRKDLVGERPSRVQDIHPFHQNPHHNHHLSDQPDQANGQSQSGEILADNNPLLAEAAQKPFKISIKLAGQNHFCRECKAGFKDADALHNHVRKQHTRPFQCVFNWAGCESTFASKNEWKRHVMSQHILLQYWVCQVDLCSRVVNKVGVSGGNSSANNEFALPNGAIFNRKDLFTQHLRRMHTPPHVKKLLKQAKQGTKAPNHPSIVEWENRLKELQQNGIKPRCRLPDYMMCPAQGCGADFHGNNAWDDRMEHVARHLESAAAGRESQVVFGGKTDTTLTNWATRPEVGIAKRVGPDTWHLDNPLRPEIMAWTEGDDDDSKLPNGHANVHGHAHGSQGFEPELGNGHAGSANGGQNDLYHGQLLADLRGSQSQQEPQEPQPTHPHDIAEKSEPSDGPASRERSRSVIEVADVEPRRSSSSGGLDEVDRHHVVQQHRDSRTAITAAD